MNKFFYSFVLLLALLLTACDTSQINANAGEDQTVHSGGKVVLTGGLTADIDDDLLNYQWKQVRGIPVKMDGADSTRITFTAPRVSKQEELVFVLIVEAKELEEKRADSVSVFVVPDANKPVDRTKPVIHLKGDKKVTLKVGNFFTDPGAIAIDNIDGDISSAIVVKSNVNEFSNGQYTVTYNVVDTAGNVADTVIRIVEIVGDNKPIITLNGEDPFIVLVGNPYNEPGATAVDMKGNSLKVSILGAQNIDTSKIGYYTVIYMATSSSGEKMRKCRTVSIRKKDVTAPVITLRGENPQIMDERDYYHELGADANDDMDRRRQVVIDATDINTSRPGEYIVKYTAVDRAGNKSTVTRTVKVKKVYLQKETSLNIPNCIGVLIEEGKDLNQNGKLDQNEIDLKFTREFYENGVPIGLRGLHKKIRRGEDVTTLNTCELTDMSFLFDATLIGLSDEAKKNIRNFNQDISGWNMKGVREMGGMFFSAEKFNQPIGNWDTSNVINMAGVFYGAKSFNQSIEDWDTSKVRTMNDMFFEAESFNQDISSWNVDNVDSYIHFSPHSPLIEKYKPKFRPDAETF